MSDYLNSVALLMLVLSPLFIPVGVTIAAPMRSGVRRIRRMLGLRRPAPRFA